jgi:hypothetical protein
VLYWFRTPPGVKVGRTALDDEALRRIERQNPDLEFDWPKILKGGGSPPTEPRPPFESRRPDRAARPRPSGVRPPSKPTPPGQSNWGLTPEQPPAEVREAAAPALGGQTPMEIPKAVTEERGLTPENLPAEGTPAHEKLGQDAVQRLRLRYADVRARIAERITDQARRDELVASAERINPDAWKSADEVATALEQYESVLASLREVAGRKRRRRKRGGKRLDGGGAQAASTPADSADAEALDVESDGGDEDQEDPGDSGPGES